ncbi:sensor histidine kinase [Arthrobacter sunyaminii]|uniref:histidine kinase n=1 Tax=Arthrobacter sunyaminii TaxID=2816859 RepID=A0A975XMB7_9MICC|nr:sensor histidine kinase [Arthrobacter sunyaminii]MBO0906938.1 sensor domain-containing protein [Arthrobacter sunyaminii]QWQ37687.1 sensor domain-containing protein [Arthrobacter sunyaminii]
MTQTLPRASRRSGIPALFRGKTWLAFAYHWISIVLTTAAFFYFVITVSLGVSLLFTWVGLVIPATMVVASRGWGWLNRGLVRHLLGTDLPGPVPFAPRPGFLGFLRSALLDGAGWRALLHMVLSCLLSIVAFTLSVTLLATGLGGVTHWFWYRFIPLQQAADGSWRRGTQVFPEVYADTPMWQWIYAGAGLLILLFVWPWINNVTARLQAGLAAALLTPTAWSLRVRTLEQSRSASVKDADERLHRIERDLHDGTQAQLVSIAMKVGDVRDRLAGAEAIPEILALLDSANGTAKEALADLRSLARGIRPAALEDGLDTALETLAAGAALPTSVTYQLARRPDPAIEAIAYFCASELVNNAVKHSRGTRIDIAVAGNDDDGLRLTVSDDGRGGAVGHRPADGTRTGLAGLRERVGSVDGLLDIQSPAGGPTLVMVELPLSSKA